MFKCCIQLLIDFFQHHRYCNYYQFDHHDIYRLLNNFVNSWPSTFFFFQIRYSNNWHTFPIHCYTSTNIRLQQLFQACFVNELNYLNSPFLKNSLIPCSSIWLNLDTFLWLNNYLYNHNIICLIQVDQIDYHLWT